MSAPGSDKETSESPRIYITITLLIQAIVSIGLVLFILRRDWENVFLTVLVLGLTLIPAFLLRRYRVYTPPEFQLIAAAFVFLSLYLGSARDFYYHFWWWDIVLHTGSGFLLGIIGFLALFLMNQTDRLPAGDSASVPLLLWRDIRRFLGVLWEITEFVIDLVVPWTNMQSRETGVGDTMLDLIVDTLGAIVVALMGWAYFKSGRYSFIADGVRKFIRKNPHLFRSLPHKRE